jgi:hypothetical protein
MQTQHDSDSPADIATSDNTNSQDTRAIAREAYIYSFPMAANYQTLYKQAINTSSHDYRAPFNSLTNASGVATSEDKFVVTPNSAEPLSTFLHQPAPPAAPVVDWSRPSADMLNTPAIFPYLNFLLQFCPTDPSETDLMARFAKLNLGPGKTFDLASFTPPVQEAIAAGIVDTKADVDLLMKKINADQIQSSDFFGTREFLKNNYLYRFIGAKLGLYGNSGADAAYFGYFVDAGHHPLDASKNNYELHFAKGAIPEYHAFWSLTMYDGKTQLLVANPIQRYLLNSTTLKSYKYGPDGSLTFYIQKNSPGKDKESNWLPAPDGPFYAIYRVYMPGEAVLNGTWKKPQMEAVATK